jgi:hypothetical protein
MYDACNPLRVPIGAQLVAGYIFGNCAWPDYAWARWPNARHVRIATVASLNDGQVLDVERSDATPDDAPGWCARARLRGQVPTVYTSASQVQAVLDACKLHAVPAPLLWVAQWDDIAELPGNAIAKQYRNDNAAGFDTSVVADHWPGVDPAPQPSHKDEPMHLFQLEGKADIYVLFEYSGRYVAVGDGDDVAALVAAGATAVQPISPTFHARLLTAFPTAVPAGG